MFFKTLPAAIPKTPLTPITFSQGTSLTITKGSQTMAKDKKTPAEKSATTSPAPTKAKKPRLEVPKGTQLEVNGEITINADSGAPKDWALSDARYNRRTGGLSHKHGEPGEVIEITMQGLTWAQGVVISNELEEGPKPNTHPVIEVVKVRITELL
jgi:hypothetical protein